MSRVPWRIRTAWWLTARLTPWLSSSQHLYYEHLEKLVRDGMRVLDVGCGKEFLMSWLRPDLYERWSASILDRITAFGVDPWMASLRQSSNRRIACAVAEQLPFAASSFDLVTANMVVEHLADPVAVVGEVMRVLRPGGCFVFHTPNLHCPIIGASKWLPHSVKRAAVPIVEGGRGKEDVFPTHYRLNTREAVATVAGRVGAELGWVDAVFTAPFTQAFGPLVVFELLMTNMLRGARFAEWRPDLICMLRKPLEG